MPQQSNRPEELRDLAQRARRLASGVSNGDRSLLIEHAEELERQASEMEKRGSEDDRATPPPPVVQEQVQVQQQQQLETGPSAEPDEPKDKG